MSDSLIQKGHILLAEPALTGDVSFSRAVILIAAHNPKGSVGFILNKPLTYTLDELIEDINYPFSCFQWWACRARQYIFYSYCARSHSWQY